MISKFARDVLSKLLGCIRKVMIFSVQHEFDRRELREAIRVAKASDFRNDCTLREDRYSQPGEYCRLQACDTVADRPDFPLQSRAAQGLKGVLTIDTSLWHKRER